MKNLLSLPLAILISFLFVEVAFALDAPNINAVSSPFSGTKQVVSGTAEPGSKLVITGGPFPIPPITVDPNGKFNVTVSLTQDNTNIFQFKVEMDGDVSEQVEITIVEDSVAAEAHAAETGKDVIAPDAPEPNKPDGTVDTYNYTIEGEAEPGSVVYVTGDDTGDAITSVAGKFAVQVRLNQNKKNKFYLEAVDDSGNISPKTILEITEQGEVGETEDVRVVIDETTGERSFQIDVADPFSDLAGHSQEEYIDELRMQGVLQGYPDGTVRPDDFVNRAELLKMAMLSFELNVLTEASIAPFSDVPKLAWFARFVETGKEEGVIAGYPDGSFKPEQNVNRAEALKIILESSRLPYNTNPAAEYLAGDLRETDAEKWYYKYVHFLINNQIIFRDSNGNVRPEELMTRGDLAEIIVRLQRFKEEQ